MNRSPGGKPTTDHISIAIFAGESQRPSTSHLLGVDSSFGIPSTTKCVGDFDGYHLWLVYSLKMVISTAMLV